MIRRTGWLMGLLIAAAMVVVLAPLGSPDPDGLQRVAIDAGFADRAADAPYEVLPGYAVPLLGDGPISLIVAGLVGVGLLFGVSWLLGRRLARRTRSTD